MRIWVFALALIAFAQPAFAASHRHSHHGARAHHAHRVVHHHYRFARARSAPDFAAPITFARTDAIDRPSFSDPSFAQNRSWNEGWTQDAWRQPPARAQQFAAFETAPVARAARDHGALDAMIARHAAANGLPVELVHRVVKRESGYNARASHAGNIGLMQIRYATARGVGYAGPASGLLDAETNLTYAVRYLAGAYRAAGGNAGRAVAYYASGYHGRGLRRDAAPQQVAWAQPAFEMRSAPVLMRDTDAGLYAPRTRRPYRQL